MDSRQAAEGGDGTGALLEMLKGPLRGTIMRPPQDQIEKAVRDCTARGFYAKALALSRLGVVSPNRVKFKTPLKYRNPREVFRSLAVPD
jgi:hypothetical protein